MQNTICRNDLRRTAVRQWTDEAGQRTLNGLDYLEVGNDQMTLTVYFLGKLPPKLRKNQQALAKYVRIEGGRRIRDIKVDRVEPRPVKQSELDDTMIVHVDKPGDFSTYTLRLVGLDGIDPQYDHVDFSFKVNCASDLDCAAAESCAPPQLVEPEINYLAKDYASFRQLILDRLALILPDWQEQHVPDLGIALVELLAYKGDYLSYYQDAVATEAYLDTARQRISVRRHARLVDYRLHEGCNARAWVSVETNIDLPPFKPNDLYFVTGLNDALQNGQTLLSEDDLRSTSADAYDVFELLVADRETDIAFYAAHSELHFYTWGQQECCLPRGATSATLADAWVFQDDPEPVSASQKRSALQNGTPSLDRDKLKGRIHLSVGDVLIFEEVIGAKTGVVADANPTRRHAVRLTSVQAGEDPVARLPFKVGDTTYQLSTPVVEITWADEDALPFPFCLSAIGPAPGCALIEHISVARGNVILVDHGRTIRPPELLGSVPAGETEMACDCKGVPGDITVVAGRFRPMLAVTPLSFWHKPAAPVPGRPLPPTAAMLRQDPRQAVPCVDLTSIPPTPDGKGPLFVLRDIDDPSLLIGRMRSDQDAAARHLRYRLPLELQRQLLESSDTPDDLIKAVRAELRSLLWAWEARDDLLASSRTHRHFVVEIDNDGVAHLRFGDGDSDRQPAAGASFYATYRVGNGAQGNVGAEAITRMVLRMTMNLPEGASLRVRNPLPAQGGVDAEPIDEVKLFAPSTFRKTLERAITAEDYALLAERNGKLQGAAATLAWTGSWYEADVVVDPRGRTDADPALGQAIANALGPYRRLGHDLAVHPPQYVSLAITLAVCVRPDYLRGHVKAVLLDLFSNRVLPNGKLGFFHPDKLTFGKGITLSELVAAAQAVPGVESVKVDELQRQFEPRNGEIKRGFLPLGPLEIARLDNDPSFPEHGLLTLKMKGGR